MQSGQAKASKTHESPPGVCKGNHLKDSQTVRNKILWSHNPEIEFFSLNLKHFVWRKPCTTHHLPQYHGSSIRLWECSSVIGIWDNSQG